MCHRSDEEKRPRRKPYVESEYIVVTRGHDFVEKCVGLHGHNEQQHQCCEDVDHPLVTRSDISPHEIDRDVRTAVGGGCDAPENQDAEHQPPEVVGIRNGIGEQVTKQDLEENIGGDDADKECRHPFDRVDKTIHVDAVHPESPADGLQKSVRRRQMPPPQLGCRRRDEVQYASLSFSNCALSSFMIVSGSPPAFLTLSAQVFSSGSAAFFHSATCAALGSETSCPDSAFILAMPACSKSAHGAATFNAHAGVQWLSITFFCAADISLYFALLNTKAKVVT